MQKLMRMNRRAVSPIIATLLLVAIAVAAAVVTYTWTMSMAANQSQQSQTSIKIDYVLFGQNGTRTNETAVLVAARNIGTVPATIQTFLLLQGDKVIVSKSDVNVVVPAGQLKQIGFTNSTIDAGDWPEYKSGGLALPNTGAIVAVTFKDVLSENTAYVVRIVTSTGFTMEGTYYTPASFS
ncbi:MAG: archaellin/type IV pilin N-terminal domain-containing protein [Candidatus Bathyarchaeia archaeon]